MRWLHLTDLHFGKREEGQRTACKSLVSEVARRTPHPLDAVFLTGDIAFSGAADEYTSFADNILLPLRELEVCHAATIVAVPGNHDSESRWSAPIQWERLGVPASPRNRLLREMLGP